MKEERLALLLGQVDQAFIAEADPTEKTARKWSRSKWAIPLAACLALAVMAFPVYKMLKPTAPVAHSYVVAGNNVGENQNMTTDTGSSDTTGDLAPMIYVDDALYIQSGNQQSFSEKKDDFVYLGIIQAVVSQSEMPNGNFQANDPIAGCEVYQYGENIVVNINGKYWLYERYDLPHELPSDGQELPGGAYIGNEADVAVQEEGTMAYQNLMDFFKKTYGADTYPDWYGGSYLDQSGHLTVNVVSSKTSGADDKELYIQIMEWAGSQQVVFSDVKYSLAFLRDLQKQVEALPELKAISSWGCGVNEESGQVKLTVPQADEALLVALAKLDPDDDAILVQVGEEVSIGTEDIAIGEPFIDMDGDPAGYGISDLPGKLPAIEGKLTDTDSGE